MAEPYSKAELEHARRACYPSGDPWRDDTDRWLATLDALARDNAALVAECRAWRDRAFDLIVCKITGNDGRSNRSAALAAACAATDKLGALSRAGEGHT